MTRTRRRWERGVDRPAGGVRAAAGRGRRVVRRGGGAVLALVALPALAAPAWAAKDDLDLVSRAAGAAGAKGNDVSFEPAVSADGRFVAFTSNASNLHPDDDDGLDDVFMRDLVLNTTTLVSRATGAAGDKGNDASNQGPAMSADGRFVAFSSFASNLHPDDVDDGLDDVFVRDLVLNTTTLVSRAAGAAGDKGNSSSFEPVISADGRFVAFTSNASNLHAGDEDVREDVFVRDLQLNTTTLVSRAAGATGDKGNDVSSEPAVSADGRSVAFSSFASNLHPDAADEGTLDVFVRDLDLNTTTLVSRATGATGDKGDNASLLPMISADGRFVAFTSGASNFHPDDDNDVDDVFVRDLQSNTTTLVSRAAGANGDTGDNFSNEPTVSADGRFVAFSSGASNLHPDDTDGGLAGEDVFVRDLQLNTTTLVSRAAGATGDKGNIQSFTPAVSADGRFVAFSSIASNLHPDDDDAVRDVFRRDVLGPRPAQPPSGQPPPGQPPSGQPPSGQRPVGPAGPAGPAQPGCPLAGNVVVGTPADDVRGGGALSDIIFGHGGADLLRGLGGADCLYGQRGADRLLGGRGRDRLFGGPGADRLVGGAGNDQLRDHPGRDRLLGGRGRDRLNPGRGGDRVAAGSGNDRVLARDSAADTIDCGAGQRDVAIVDPLDDTSDCERVRLPIATMTRTEPRSLRRLGLTRSNLAARATPPFGRLGGDRWANRRSR